MKKDKLVGIILVAIGAVLLIVGTIVMLKEVSKEPEPQLPQEETNKNFIVNGIEYKKYSIVEKNDKMKFQITVQNTYIYASAPHYVAVTVYDKDKKVLETIECLIPGLDISETMHLEFDYPGEKIPEDYTVFIEATTPAPEVG